MTDQGEVLRLASLEEAPRLFQLILRRITWLEERGIRQWERDDYLTYYPLTYFQERARNGALYGPVSYTHLDVYKRQPLGGSCSSTCGTKCPGWMPVGWSGPGRSGERRSELWPR